MLLVILYNSLEQLADELVPTNLASIVVFGGLEAFEKRIGVPLDVTAQISYLSIKCGT